ncbi:MAG: 2OG-Fe(II) oxygenase family protein [Pseudomonadales bacterium]|nr:2OG-Fe(II) oxygenase family protein [Pseudomonadales bacterium]
MNAQLLPIFPEPIVEYKNLGIDPSRLDELYESQSWASTNSEDNPDYFLKISKDLKVLDKDNELKKSFLGVLNGYTKTFMLYANEFRMTTSWFTKAEKGNISIFHNHGNAMFCAVYYFGLPAGCKSKITFEKPFSNTFDLKPTEYNALNGPSYVFQMENDSMLVFPSYLKHKVNRHESNFTRKSLAMNFVPQGVIGSGTNELRLDDPT